MSKYKIEITNRKLYIKKSTKDNLISSYFVVIYYALRISSAQFQSLPFSLLLICEVEQSLFSFFLGIFFSLPFHSLLPIIEYAEDETGIKRVA